MESNHATTEVTARNGQLVTNGDVATNAAKRHRKDEDNVSETTESCFDEDLPDADPFITVNYKKQQRQGIPVVFHSAPDRSFWRVNPNVLATEVLAVTKEKLLEVRITRDGSVLALAASLEAANRLLATTTLMGIPVEPRVPASYSRNVGRIKNVPLEYSDSELLDYLKDAGVISVRRQSSTKQTENGEVETRFYKNVILHFRSDRPMPARVMLGFTSHPVTEFFGVVQCFRCQRHGHIAKYCRGPQRCKICAGSHSHKDCTSRRQPRCANCDGPHPSSFGKCPQKKAAAEQKKENLQYGTGKRHRPAANPDLVEDTRPKQRTRQRQWKELHHEKETLCRCTEKSEAPSRYIPI
ncbi:hypothetical protein MTO96_035739 [Rhipicephalus appendiculatus]